MSITRKFFDWSAPALPQIVEWLCREHERGGHVDLSGLVLVFPGRRAGRRFEELLTEQTQGRNDLPRIVTPSELPELLYTPQRPFATDLTQRLAWAQALKTLSKDELRVLTSRPPEEGDDARWTALAELLSRNHTELAGDGVDFASVALQGDGLPGFREHDRWQLLWNVQDRYLALLDDLELWDRETARLKAIENHECRTDRDILLVATVDMNRTLRQMLDQVSERVTALIHAPPSLAGRFDDHGCLRPAEWTGVEIDIGRGAGCQPATAPSPIENPGRLAACPTSVRMVDGPAEQAAEVAYTLARFEGRYAAQQITIGIPDERLIPYVRRQLGDCGIETRSIVERPLPQTLPATFLAAAADYLDDPRTTRFAVLARHPDVAAWLEGQGVLPGWLGDLDDYIAEHLQPRLGSWLGKAERAQRLRRVTDLVHALLEPLRKPPRPLGEWSEVVTDVLLTLYGHLEFDEEQPTQRVTLAACRCIQQALDDQTKIPSPLAPTSPAAEAIRLALEAVQGAVIPPRSGPEAIELLGWLEMPLDDAPAAIITSFNEGFVPTSVNSDLFLPNGLRQKLGVLDNTRRYARDAYALCALLHSRPSTTLIVGRRDQEGNLLKPSRLLFAAPPQVIAERIQQFYSDDRRARDERPPLPGGLVTTRDTPAFAIPRPKPRPAGDVIVRVTAFKDYIACPYRYYLNHELGLGPVDDRVEELDALGFGNLLHDVLAEFGTSELADCDDEGEIRAYLRGTLDNFAKHRLGDARLPSVRIQLEQLQRRLDGFAQWQSHHVDLGYRIHFVEVPDQSDPVRFEVGDGRHIFLKGRIDRIDYHEERDEWLILDYKTGAKGESPEATHLKGGKGDRRWVDLQLPLYRRLAEPLGVRGNVAVGYVVLPDHSTRAGLARAEWTAEDFRSAEETARDVGRKLLDGIFWPPANETDLKYASNFPTICHEGAFDREVLREVLKEAAT